MAKTLVVVESPAKAKTIEKYLGGDYAVRASYGHIRDLGKGYGGLGRRRRARLRPATTWCPRTPSATSPSCSRALRTADDLILATDFDREGEAIAYHVASLLGVDPATAKRVTFTEITRDAILEAFTQPRSVDLRLFDAQEARRILDRLVGYRISPILWKRIRPGLSAGRVQSVAVRLIVEREREIQRVRPGRVLERRRPPRRRRTPSSRSSPGSPRSPRASSRRRPTRRASCSAPRPTRPPTSSGCAAPPTGWRRWSGRSASARRRRRSRPRPCSRRPRASSGSARARR